MKMTPNRWVAVACVAATLPAVCNKARAIDLMTAQHTYANVAPQCPPGDVGGWRRVDGPRADRVEAIPASEEYFVKMCGDAHGYVAPNIYACAGPTLADPVFGGYYATIYLRRVPFESLSGIQQTHELCHTQGWAHDWWLDTSVFSIRYTR